jgi:hypothetical protein
MCKVRDRELVALLGARSGLYRSLKLKRGAYEKDGFAEVQANLETSRKAKYFIFRTWITVNGVKRYAKDYGYKAWRIPIYK